MIAKHLLDAEEGLDRLDVALVADGAAIDGVTRQKIGILSGMRSDVDAAHLSDEHIGVGCLVCTEDILVCTGTIRVHHVGRIPLHTAHALGDAVNHAQVMKFVDKHMPAEAERYWMDIGFPA